MLSFRAAADSASAIGNTSPYGYTPSLAPGIAYLVVFSFLALVHVGLAYKYKYRMVFVTLVPGGIRKHFIFCRTHIAFNPFEEHT